jgi:hypothetical protein
LFLSNNPQFWNRQSHEQCMYRLSSSTLLERKSLVLLLFVATPHISCLCSAMPIRRIVFFLCEFLQRLDSSGASEGKRRNRLVQAPLCTNLVLYPAQSWVQTFIEE